MNWQTIASILSIFISLGTLITILIGWGWWIGKVDQALKNLGDTIGELKRTIEKLQSRDDIYLKREDFLLQVAARNKEISDIWKAQNDLRSKFEDCRANNIHCGSKG